MDSNKCAKRITVPMITQAALSPNESVSYNYSDLGLIDHQPYQNWIHNSVYFLLKCIVIIYIHTCIYIYISLTRWRYSEREISLILGLEIANANAQDQCIDSPPLYVSTLQISLVCFINVSIRIIIGSSFYVWERENCKSYYFSFMIIPVFSIAMFQRPLY